MERLNQIVCCRMESSVFLSRSEIYFVFVLGICKTNALHPTVQHHLPTIQVKDIEKIETILLSCGHLLAKAGVAVIECLKFKTSNPT